MFSETQIKSNQTAVEIKITFVGRERSRVRPRHHFFTRRLLESNSRSSDRTGTRLDPGAITSATAPPDVFLEQKQKIAAGIKFVFGPERYRVRPRRHTPRHRLIRSLYFLAIYSQLLTLPGANKLQIFIMSTKRKSVLMLQHFFTDAPLWRLFCGNVLCGVIPLMAPILLDRLVCSQ